MFLFSISSHLSSLCIFAKDIAYVNIVSFHFWHLFFFGNIHVVCITHKMYSLIPFRSYSYVDITLIFWVGSSFCVCWNDLSSLGCIYMYWLYSPILFFSQLYLCVSLSSTVSSCISLSLAVFPSVYCILQFLFFPRLYLCVSLF